jgi:hypothetical protein
MKWARRTSSILCMVLGVQFSAVGTARSATLSTGFATIDYDQAAWSLLAAESGLEMPVMTLSAFFNQAEANALDYNQVLKEPQATYSYLGQIYTMNGSTVVNRSGRTTQPTTFEFTPGALTQHTGRIGLGGITRFAVNGGGNLLFGDFTLQYDKARLARGGTGWYVRGNIPPVGAVYDLLNVAVTEGSTSISLSGDLSVTFEIANLLYSTPADTLRDVGDFRFVAEIETSLPQLPFLSGLVQADGRWLIRVTQGLPGAGFSVLSSTDCTTPSSNWLVLTSGLFDAQGNGSVEVNLDTSETSRYYRIQLP